jgi:serine/threonine protein kinase
MKKKKDTFLFCFKLILFYIHSAGVIHWNLRPANIRISENLNLTIFGFGHAHVATSGFHPGFPMTQ